MQEVPYDKLVNFGEFMDRFQAGTGKDRAPKGLQMLEREIDRGVRENTIPAYNADGPGSIVLHAVREQGSMAVVPNAGGPASNELPKGFLREANIPVAHILDRAIEAGLYQQDRTSRGHQKTIADALAASPDHKTRQGSMLLMNQPKSESPLPERFRKLGGPDAAPSTIDVTPEAIRRMSGLTT
jgi:hypothetical protein